MSGPSHYPNPGADLNALKGSVGTLSIEVHPPRRGGGQLHLSCSHHFSEQTEAANPLPDLFFEIDEEWAGGDLQERAHHSFILASLMLAMRTGHDFVIPGETCPLLLGNLTEFRDAWVSWRPHLYFRSKLIAEAAPWPEDIDLATAPKPDSAIMAFSGGLDSCFTAYRHAFDECGHWRRDLQAGVLVHGFDIPLSEGAMFAQARSSSETILASVDLPLATVRTNYRDSFCGNWEHECGILVGAVLHLFSHRAASGIIASSDEYATIGIPWGSSPLTDPLLSSCHFHLLHDGCGFSRTQRALAVTNWPTAMENLRVCWQGENKGANCGTCDKCMRTRLNFLCAGATPPDCLGGDLSAEVISELPAASEAARHELGCIVEAARKMNRQGQPWLVALENRLKQVTPEDEWSPGKENRPIKPTPTTSPRQRLRQLILGR